MRRKNIGILMILTVGISACASSKPQLNNWIYRDAETSFRIGELPDGWDRVDIDSKHDISWHNTALDSVIMVNASCDPANDIPLQSLVGHLLIGFTDRKDKTETLRELDGREALFTELLARLDGVQRQMLLVVVKKDGCAYDFGVVGVPGPTFEKARADLKTLLRNFQTLR